MANYRWDAIVAILALGGTMASIILIWWKVSSDNLLIKREVETNRREFLLHAEKNAKDEEKMILLVTTKAACSDVIKLAEMVDALDKRVVAHHEDTRRHRTEDFETRVTSLVRSIEDYNKTNTETHEKIMDMIRSLSK